MSKLQKILFLSIIPMIVLSCGIFTPSTPQPAATLDALYTSVAQTLMAVSTQSVAIQPSPTPTLYIPTSTFPVLVTPTPQLPVSTCDSADFVSDVTYSDGSTLARGDSFTKTWRIKNTGTCSWNTSYALVFVGGDQLNAPGAVTLGVNVSPGQIVDLSVNMSSPNKDGHYKGYWKLRNAAGVIFGVGSQGDSSFYVDINVRGSTHTVYNMVENFCDADWKNNNRDLPCPGTEGDDKGFALIHNTPKLENGTVSSDPALLTYPKSAGSGFIQGVYPPRKIQDGDHFQALINCEYKANDCNVIFRVEYQIGNGDYKTLGQWHEIYEGQSYPVNIDLSGLAGQKVKLILTVFANGTAHEDFALWVDARITRPGNPPAATATLAPTKTATATGTVTSTGTATLTPTATNTPTATATP